MRGFFAFKCNFGYFGFEISPEKTYFSDILVPFQKPRFVYFYAKEQIFEEKKPTCVFVHVFFRVQMRFPACPAPTVSFWIAGNSQKLCIGDDGIRVLDRKKFAAVLPRQVIFQCSLINNFPV